MSLTDLLAVTAIGMFVANLMVAIRAVLQGNKAATPEPRIEAINHVREALLDLIRDGVVKTNTPDSLRKALHVSTTVFSSKVREHIDQAYAMACRLQHIGWQMTDQDAHDIVALRRDLQTLIAYMNEEAALVGSADPPRGGLGAGCKQRGRDAAMSPEMLAIIAIVVSGLSLFVSGGCLFVAYAAKHQAKNAAMLKQRNEAIALLRAALSALKEHRAVTRAAAQNITKAKDLADLFNPALRSVLGSVQRTAQRLSKPHPKPNSGARNLDDIRALESDLHKFIDEMSQEMALVG